MNELLSRLCNARGPSGDEGEIRSLISELAVPYADELFTDAMGNLHAIRRGDSPGRVLVAAHMDEVGLIVTRITDDGYLRFEAVGGIDPRVIAGRGVLVGPKRLPGVIGMGVSHLLSGDEKGKAPKMSSLLLDIGAAGREGAEGLVSLGDTAVFDDPYSPFGDGYVMSRALDNRAGCAAALLALRKKPACDTHFVFTVQEEVGLRGAYAAANLVKPDFAVVVDTTTAADIPGVAAEGQACHLGEGAVVFLMDHSAVYHPRTVAFGRECAEKRGIPWQHKSVVAGGLDSGAIQRSRLGVETLALATPCRYLHSPSCVIKLDDLEAVASLLTGVLEEAAEYLSKRDESAG